MGNVCCTFLMFYCVTAIFCGDETETRIGTNEVDSAFTCLKRINVGKFDLSDSLMLQMSESHETCQKHVKAIFLSEIKRTKKRNSILHKKVIFLSFLFD